MKKIIFILFVIILNAHIAYGDPYPLDTPIACDDIPVKLFAAYNINYYDCSQGYYLPADTESCVSCPSSAICSGGSYEYNSSKFQGIVLNNPLSASTLNNVCADNFPTRFDAIYTINTYKCSANYYLPADATNCTACPNDRYCPGGNYTFNETETQGLYTCRPEKVEMNGACFDPKFTITTTNMSANDSFIWKMSAIGEFAVDCGAGGDFNGTGQQTGFIDRDNTTMTQYSCNYTNSGTHVIRFVGEATGYNSSYTVAAIRFYEGTPGYINSISGSLGQLFPTVNQSQPTFYNTFRGASNLTSVPEELFSGISGTAANYMFKSTFESTSLASIPSGLFSGITGAADHMFSQTFVSNKFTSIPENLFHSLQNTSVGMFSQTFLGCTKLKNIPANLFNNIRVPKSSMFSGTFWRCYALETVPSGLFGNISGTATDLFNFTFRECTSLKSVPYDLFSGVTGISNRIFVGAFQSDSNLNTFVYPDGTTTDYVPAQLFGSVSGTNYSSYTVGGNSNAAMKDVFNGATKIATSCPSSTTQNITGFEDDWNGRVSCASYWCDRGYYLPLNGGACTECLNNSWCPGGKYIFNATNNQGINSCPVEHPHAPKGMWLASQCGRRFHMSDGTYHDILYLHQQPANPTLHGFKIIYGENNTLYSANAVLKDTTPGATVPKVSAGATHAFHAMIKDVVDGVEVEREYLFCDDSVPECRNNQ